MPYLKPCDWGRRNPQNPLEQHKIKLRSWNTYDWKTIRKKNITGIIKHCHQVPLLNKKLSGRSNSVNISWLLFLFSYYYYYYCYYYYYYWHHHCIPFILDVSIIIVVVGGVLFTSILLVATLIIYYIFRTLVSLRPLMLP